MNKFTSFKKFEKEFPQAAREAKYSSGVDIFYRDKSYWLNGELQLTGWETGADGKVLTHGDIEDIATKRIKEFKEGKAALEKESLVVRFARLIAEAKKLEPRFRYYTTYRHAGGDKATILDDGDVWFTFTGIDYQIKATNKKNRAQAIEACVQLFEAYTGAKVAL